MQQVAVGEIAANEGGNDNRQHDEDPPHGRRIPLSRMQFIQFLRIAHNPFAKPVLEPANCIGSENQGRDERNERGQSDPRRQKHA